MVAQGFGLADEIVTLLAGRPARFFQPRLANLSAPDKAALVAFLRTLTDLNITTDMKYSNPFK